MYFIYGSSFCLNVASERTGVGAAVLLRAGEPLLGLELMRARRGPGVSERDLCRGPGRLCTALGIDRRADGLDLVRAGPLWLAAAARPPAAFGTSPRIGLSENGAAQWPLRFFEIGSPFVSGPRARMPSGGAART